jgi:hypothetical protein
MKQILHIFVKDARRQWLEILISLAVTAALVFNYWSPQHPGAMFYGGAVKFFPFGLVSDVPDLLKFIVPFSWWLLISPVIHEEKLVGDRQFWITRPYEWKKLLAAKVLFLVVFLYAPLLLAQCAILAEAGFTPFSSLRGLLYDSLLLTCVLVLPLIALATVTKNFARMTLAVLGVAGCFIAIALLAMNAPPDRIAIPYTGEITFFVSLCLCAAVVILQYSRRNIKVSWALLALIMVVLLGAFTRGGGAPDDSVMDRTYPPLQRTAAAAQFAYLEKEGGEPSAFVTDRRDRVGILVPVLVSGVPDGTVTIPNLLKVTIQSAGGARWTSVWQAYSDDKFFTGERVVSARFTMPRAVYDNFTGKPLNVQITFALTQVRAGSAEQLPLVQGDFAVQGLGVCTSSGEFAERPEIRGLTCRAPLRHPELTLIRTALHTAPCSGTSPNPDDNMQTAAWIGSTERDPADFGIVPVWSSPVSLTNQFVMAGNGPIKMRHLCPQTPITFTRYTLAARTQASFSIDGFQLPHLNAGQLTVINHD